MHPPTHALAGWAIANLAPGLDRRERALVFFAGVLPDLDGLTILGGAAFYQDWHRILCHNLPFAILAATAAAGFARTRRLMTAALVFVNLHVHLLGDYLGSAGPDGSIWGIPYFWPFTRWQFENPYQWRLGGSWQNAVITLVFLAVAAWIAVRWGRSPVEPFSASADAAVVKALRSRLGGKSQVAR